VLPRSGRPSPERERSSSLGVGTEAATANGALIRSQTLDRGLKKRSWTKTTDIGSNRRPMTLTPRHLLRRRPILSPFTARLHACCGSGSRNLSRWRRKFARARIRKPSMTFASGAGACSRRSARFFRSRARAKCGDCGEHRGEFAGRWANGATAMSCSKLSAGGNDGRAATPSGGPGLLCATICSKSAASKWSARAKN
jgi:hypothetical protein